jgi:hypothetical protein
MPPRPATIPLGGNAGGRTLGDLRKVNYVILGGENASEHLLM